MNSLITYRDTFEAQHITLSDIPYFNRLANDTTINDLWFIGNIDLLSDNNIISINGSRASTKYGNAISANTGAVLAQNNITVMTSGAFGISTLALEAQLYENYGPIVFLPSSLDKPYPNANLDLFNEIAKHGLVISAAKPNTSPNQRLLIENQQNIVNFSSKLIIIEASLRSNALNTAQYALKQNKPVGVYPGPINSINTLGSNHLMCDRQTKILDNYDTLLTWVKS